MTKPSIIEALKTGQRARLFPVVADSKREERATSILLAVFRVVPSYAEAVLSDAGASITKRAAVRCYTEVSFKSKNGSLPRPDGLIVVQKGGNEWSALIESKIGSSELRTDQVEQYLDLAKEVGANALITISNQYATLPTHHPISVQKSKTRSVDIYHFSWLSLLSKAVILSETKQVDDPEQAFVLKELVRYLDHDSSGVTNFGHMGSGWKDLCLAIQQGTPIPKNAEYLHTSVAAWRQLIRFLSIKLGMAVNANVQTAISRANTKNPSQLLQDDLDSLSKNHMLAAELLVPNAASNIVICADLMRRTVNFSMKLAAPGDKSKPTAAINWFTRQLRNLEDKTNLSIRVEWPGRTQDTGSSLTQAIEDPSVLVPNEMKNIPKAIEIVRIIDLAGRFMGSRTFIEDIANSLPRFYGEIGQVLVKWTAKPPKVKESTDTVDEAVDVDIQDQEMIPTFEIRLDDETASSDPQGYVAEQIEP